MVCSTTDICGYIFLYSVPGDVFHTRSNNADQAKKAIVVCQVRQASTVGQQDCVEIGYAETDQLCKGIFRRVQKTETKWISYLNSSARR